jgi:hypothetical protein
LGRASGLAEAIRHVRGGSSFENDGAVSRTQLGTEAGGIEDRHQGSPSRIGRRLRSLRALAFVNWDRPC